MRRTTTTQKEQESKNKQDIERALTNKEEFLEYYYTHTNKETRDCFGFSTEKVVLKALKLAGYDPNYKKTHNVMKGRKATRSHESYVLGGKKSGDTQKKHWENKSEEEKEAWSVKQSFAHLNSPTYKDKIAKTNRAYRNSLTPEERDRQDKMRSESLKKWWSNLSEKEKQEQINKHFNGGAGYKSKDSKPNLMFKELLDNNKITHTREFRLNKYSYDFKVGNTLVEINPSATHNSTWSPFSNPLDKMYHYNKSKCAFENGYKCIHVFDWDDLSKIAELLKPRESVGARECKVKEVSKEDAMDFINKHHLQGYARDRIRLGLYHKGELVSIMTFHKPRYNKNYEYELIRYCSSMNVIGGAERLFKHFIENYSPKSVITYCDKSKFTGGLYAKLGFSLLRRGKPSKHWYNIKTGEHYTDNLIRQQGFSRIVNHVDATQDNVNTNNNNELMIEHGFVEVYDCGQDTYCYIA